LTKWAAKVIGILLPYDCRGRIWQMPRGKEWAGV